MRDKVAIALADALKSRWVYVSDDLHNCVIDGGLFDLHDIADAAIAVVIEECAAALEADAQLCDCAAHSEGECACGAWCEWKTITSARAVEIVRELATPPERPAPRQ